MCRVRKAGKPFPSLADAFAELELLNWQTNGTVLVHGIASLMATWASANGYTPPKVALAGAYFVDAETLFYVNARGQLVSSAAEVLRSLPTSAEWPQRATESEAREALAHHHRVFVLSDLDSFHIKLSLLDLFGMRDRSLNEMRWH
jgi:hypothetical protein